METETIKVISCYSSQHGPALDLLAAGQAKQITISVSRRVSSGVSVLATAGVGPARNDCKNTERGEKSR